MKLSILFCFILICLNASCQGLDEAEFEKAKKDYKEMVESSIFQQNMKDKHTMYSKSNGLDVPRNNSQEELRKWFTKNLNQTNFKSVDEAVALQSRIDETNKKIREDYKDTYNAFMRATIDQRVIISKPESKLMQSFPQE